MWSNVWTNERAERSARSRHTIALRSRLLLAVSCAALLFSACAKQQLGQASPKSEGVTVLSSELAGHIAQIAEKSPTFRASWQKLHSSGVPIRIGTDRQLHAELPSRYRKQPRNWTAVTLARGRTGNLSHVVVALNENAMEIIAERAASGDEYMKGELDRVLIHEIYGHVVPVVEARDMSKGCPDAPRPGESRSCVSIREAEIAAELGTLN